MVNTRTQTSANQNRKRAADSPHEDRGTNSSSPNSSARSCRPRRAAAPLQFVNENQELNDFDDYGGGFWEEEEGAAERDEALCDKENGPGKKLMFATQQNNNENDICDSLGRVFRPPRSRRSSDRPKSKTKQTGNGTRSKATSSRSKPQRKAAKYEFQDVTMAARNTSIQIAQHQFRGRDAATSSLGDMINAQPQEAVREQTEMPLALSKALQMYLFSNETVVAGGVLSFITLHHHQLPALDLCRDLVLLFQKGPATANHKFHFPDCQRLEMAEQYLDVCVRVVTHNQNNLPHIWDRLLEAARGTFWKDCVTSLSTQHYTIPGDEHRRTKFALNRRAQTIHLHACCANLMVQMLHHELDDLVVSQRGLAKVGDALCGKILAHEILNCRQRGGAKHALKTIWKLFVKRSVELQDVVSNGATPAHSCQNTTEEEFMEDTQLFLHAQSARLLKSLGKISSYVAWLYHLTGSRTNLVDLAHFLHTISAPLIDEKVATEDVGDKIRLRLVLGLGEGGFLPELRPILADMMGVGKVFNTIFSY